MKFYSLVVSLFAILLITGCSEDSENNYPNYPTNKKVIVIGIDGCRSDVITEAIAPYMHRMTEVSNTSFNFEHKAESITISGPNWASICTGVHWEKHNVQENFFSNNDLETYPHFFHHLNTYYGEEQVNLFSITHWFPINYFMALPYADQSPVKFGYTDQQVYDEALEILVDERWGEPDVLFLHFDQLDHEGHAHGYSPDVPEYVQAVKNLDEYVEDLIGIIQNRTAANNEDWLTVVVSDHGGLGQGHDGGADVPEIRNTILLLNNSAINGPVDLVASDQVDVVATILNFLEVDVSTIDLDGENLIN